MLGPIHYVAPTELDQRIFAATVPADHYLRRVQHAVDFDRCRDLLAAAYCDALGRPAVEPLLLLKLEFVQWEATAPGSPPARGRQRRSRRRLVPRALGAAFVPDFFSSLWHSLALSVILRTQSLKSQRAKAYLARGFARP